MYMGGNRKRITDNSRETQDTRRGDGQNHFQKHELGSPEFLCSPI